MSRTVTCPGCGVELAAAEGESHPYMTGSPACWASYGDLLAADFSDPRRMAHHQLTVDAYAVQHPGGADRRAVQSVGLHLMTLGMVLEDGADPALGPRLHRQMVNRPAFERLAPVPPPGVLTHLHVPRDGDPETARRMTFEWAEAAWTAWTAFHPVVDGWLRTAGLRGPTG